jgi:hypothetical protein
MGFGFLLNFVALILSIIALISGLATEGARVEALPWVEGDAELTDTTGAVTANYKLFISMKLRYETVDCEESSDTLLCGTFVETAGFTHKEDTIYERKLEWDDVACADNPNIDVDTEKMCKDCKENLVPSFSLVLSILVQFPTMTTDLQRSTRYGDVNCQSAFGLCTNIFGFVVSLGALMSFRKACYNDLPGSLYGQDVDWSIGVGYNCVFVATVIKLLDASVHFLLPTPKQKWKKPPAGITEVEDYMMLAMDDADDAGKINPTQIGQPASSQ